MEKMKMAKVYDMLDTVCTEMHGDRDIKDMVVASILDSIHHELHAEEIRARRNRDIEVEYMMTKVDAMLHAADDLFGRMTASSKKSDEVRRFEMLFSEAVDLFDKLMKAMEG